MNCPYCGCIHTNAVCHLIKAIEYFADGTVKRVEFKTPADFPEYTSWPHLMPQAPTKTGG